MNDTRPRSESTTSENACWVGDGAPWVRTSGDEGSDHDLSLDKDLGVSKARAPTSEDELIQTLQNMRQHLGDRGTEMRKMELPERECAAAWGRTTSAQRMTAEVDRKCASNGPAASARADELRPSRTSSGRSGQVSPSRNHNKSGSSGGASPARSGRNSGSVSPARSGTSRQGSSGEKASSGSLFYANM